MTDEQETTTVNQADLPEEVMKPVPDLKKITIEL